MTTFKTYLLILIINQPNEIQRQQHQRFTEIFNQGKQRYIQAVGNSKSYLSSVKGKDYLSDEEREEAKQLLKQIFQTPTIQPTQRDSDMARGNRGLEELKS
ncbi:MAG: hypothetical protein ACKPAE_02730 [Microcystis panniformis]